MRPERTLIKLSCVLLMQLLAVSALSAQPASDPEAGARAALDRFLIAFNSGDNELVRQQLHFPHVTHRANSIFVADQPADFAIPYESNRGSGWARSRWDNFETYLVSDEKVNLGVDFSRLNAAGEVIARGYVFYIFTKKEGRWAMQYRAGNLGSGNLDEAELAQAQRDAFAAVEYFFAAFNANDRFALSYVNHVPQAAIVYEDNRFILAESMNSSLIETDFDGLRDREDWLRSEYSDIVVRGATPDRVIFELTFERINSAGEVYMRIPATWVIARVDGRWGMQFRSLMASTIPN